MARTAGPFRASGLLRTEFHDGRWRRQATAYLCLWNHKQYSTDNLDFRLVVLTQRRSTKEHTNFMTWKCLLTTKKCKAANCVVFVGVARTARQQGKRMRKKGAFILLMLSLLVQRKFTSHVVLFFVRANMVAAKKRARPCERILDNAPS